MLSIDDIATLFARRGHEQYAGEPVTQLEHALQTALLAEEAGADDELVTACLLHDLGHLLQDLGDTPTLRGVDDVHQYRALPFLRGLFGDAVLDPIKLHVDAKRYLCLMEPSYWAHLSPASKQSLEKQGGVFSEREAEAFISQAFATESVRLRRYDDLAKVPSKSVPDLSHYAQLLVQVAH